MQRTRTIQQLCASLWAPLLLCWALTAIAEVQGSSTDVVRPDERIVTVHVLHYAPSPQGDALKSAADILKSKFPTLKMIADPDDSTEGFSVRAELFDMKAEGFEPPSMELLKYYGRGITREQAQAMQQSQFAVVLSFSYPFADALAAIEKMNAYTRELALRTKGLIWDAETRELFSPQAWQERRLAPADHGYPDVGKHIAIHAYQTQDHVRAITLGMRKFGLPDLVVEQFSWSLNDQMGNTINFMAQALVEGATPALGAYDFDIAGLKNEQVRQRYQDRLLEDSKTVARLTFAVAKRDEGDPENRLVEIRFDRYAGQSVHERNQNFASEFFGSAETVSYVKHNEAVLAASARAKKKLPELRKAFNAGLEPGEQFLVKAPFATPDGGNEWMWVEVVSWKGERIEGLLGNEPVEIPDLHAGATVQVKQADIFDYVRYKADGSEEGNETGKIIARMPK